MATPAAATDQAHRLSPAAVEATLKLALAQHQRGALPLAVALYDQVLTIDPANVDALQLRGMALLTQGNRKDAKTSLARAVKLDSKLAEAFSNLGVLHLADKEIEAAVAAFKAALEARPDFTNARNGLGVALTELGRLNEAIVTFDKALATAADANARTDILANRSIALQSAGRWQEALDDLQSAISIAPERATIWRNMAKPLIALGRLDEAEVACTRALTLNAGDQTSHYERSFVRLLKDDIAGGFDDYRSRPTVDRNRFPMPQEPLPIKLSGRRFRLVLEQGLGEHLFFLRYAPVLMARGASIACEIDPKLAAILHNHPSLGRIVTRDEMTPDHESILIGDLPFLVGDNRTPSSLMLKPDPALQAKLKDQLAALGPAPYIALTWRAGIQDGKSLSKIVPLDALAIALEGQATLVSIQRQPVAGETEQLAQRIGRPVHDLSSLNADLASMLAFLSLVDDYIGVSNTNMHLRAGFGLPARVLIPHPPEFRWLATGDRSPWFHDFALYRAEMGGWQSTMAKLSADLAR